MGVIFNKTFKPNSFQISAWPLSVPASNGTYLQHPVAFLPDASALTQSPSRRLDKSDKLEVRDLKSFKYCILA